MNDFWVTYLLVGGAIGLMYKIVYDYLRNRKNNHHYDVIYKDCKERFDLHWREIQSLYDKIENIYERLENKIEILSNRIDEKFNFLIDLINKKGHI